MRMVLAVLMVGCAGGDVDLAPEAWQGGADLSAPPGELEWTVGMIAPGSDARITLSGVSLDEEAHIVLSTRMDGPAFCPGAVGLCFDIPRPVTYMGVADERGDGWLSLQFAVPRGARIGTPVYIQAAMDSWPDGWYLSPVAETTVDGLFCPDVWDPVCGVNGVTYGNGCEAQVQGWPVDYEGPC